MKKIVRGKDLTLRVPVRRIVNGEKQRFPLPACEEIEVNLVNAFRRRKMEYTIGVEDDSLLKVSVHSSEMALGSYALEVKGKLFGSSWRSNEYEQLQLVDNNASGDTEFGETDEGEDSVEMDTALVVLAPVIVIDGDIEVIKDEIANGVRDGAWLPVKAGRDADGNVVLGAVAEGIDNHFLDRQVRKPPVLHILQKRFYYFYTLQHQPCQQSDYRHSYKSLVHENFFHLLLYLLLQRVNNPHLI